MVTFRSQDSGPPPIHSNGRFLATNLSLALAWPASTWRSSTNQNHADSILSDARFSETERDAIFARFGQGIPIREFIN